MSIPDLVIRELRVRPVVAPLPRPIRTASGDVLDAPLLLIDVLTDAGVAGRAYAFAYTPLTPRSLTRFVRDIAPELVGKSVSPRADATDGEASQAGRLAGIRRHGGRHSRRPSISIHYRLKRSISFQTGTSPRDCVAQRTNNGGSA